MFISFPAIINAVRTINDQRTPVALNTENHPRVLSMSSFYNEKEQRSPSYPPEELLQNLTADH